MSVVFAQRVDLGRGLSQEPIQLLIRVAADLRCIWMQILLTFMPAEHYRWHAA